MNRNFQGIWLPKEIWLHPTLSIQAKCLWAEIQSLHCDDRGGCYASDEYLMEFLSLKKSRFQEVLKELKDAGLLKKISFDGRRVVRKAIMPGNINVTQAQHSKKETGKQLPGKPESCYPENRKADTRFSGLVTTGENPGHIYLDTRKDTRIEREGGEPPHTPKKEKILKPDKKEERAVHVHTSDKEHQLLVAKHGEEKVKAAYQVLSEWKEDNPKSKWKKSDKRSIERWVFTAIEEKELKAKELEKRKANLKGNTQAKRPSQLNNASEGSYKFDRSRVKTYTNNGGK